MGLEESWIKQLLATLASHLLGLLVIAFDLSKYLLVFLHVRNLLLQVFEPIVDVITVLRPAPTTSLLILYHFSQLLLGLI